MWSFSFQSMEISFKFMKFKSVITSFHHFPTLIVCQSAMFLTTLTTIRPPTLAFILTCTRENFEEKTFPFSAILCLSFLPFCNLLSPF